VGKRALGGPRWKDNIKMDFKYGGVGAGFINTGSEYLLTR
jgi:hypothetical protein